MKSSAKEHLNDLSKRYPALMCCAAEVEAAALVEAAAEEAVEEAVLVEEEPPQAARAAPMVTAPEASRKLRREIFFIRVNLLHGFPIKKFILKNSAPGVVGLC